jgi:hypothetical protein
MHQNLRTIKINMKKIFVIIIFIAISGHVFASDSIVGNWRGTIIGHTDNRDYFINARIDTAVAVNLKDKLVIKKGEYFMRLKVFSGDYTGEFLLSTNLRYENKLYIESFLKITEFPYSIPHIEDCFTGYFMVKRADSKINELDLYRNPIYRNLEDFKKKDSSGNYIPDFECFTTVLLHPVISDTTFTALERKTDSVISAKKTRVQEVAKRKVVSSKEWTVKREKITLQVWDNNKQDSDIISLKFNDTWILNNFLLKKEKYTIHLELKQKENQLLLFAENLGSIPPNTAAISIDDNELVRTFILNSDMSKSETVKIILMK